MNVEPKEKDKSKKEKLTKLIYFIPLIVIFAFSLCIGLDLTTNTVNAEEIIVYKSPTCGCCNKWIKHLEKQGFEVKAENMQDMNPVKKEYGVQQNYQSCHTAKVGKYFIEGHVPAKDIKRLLKETPDIKGLSVPGMPMGSPGMEGHRKDNYSVLAIDKNDNAAVYSSY